MDWLTTSDGALGGETFAVSTWLFLRLLGVVYLIAFVSASRQVMGLIGSRGVWPIGTDFPAAAGYARWKFFFQRPTLFLWMRSDAAIRRLCVAGVACSLLLIAGVAPLPMLVALWLMYLSLLQVSGVFLHFQWDSLLLETGFLAILMAPLEWFSFVPSGATPTGFAHLLALWLLFRLIFSSGVCKIRSGDKTWRDGTAMTFHYMTQPLPNRPAWRMHNLPRRFHVFETYAMFAIELVVPFAIFAPPPFNYAAAGAITGLMVLIFATGNYTFFNVLSVALCVPVFDDGAFAWLLERTNVGWTLPVVADAPPLWWQWVVIGLGVVVVVLSLDAVWRLFKRVPVPWPGWIRGPLDRLRPFLLVNNYGLFANMTTRRPEIVIQGSVDGKEWKTYEFWWKPGDRSVPPRQVAPHQPRLDWQMWFAALGNYQRNPWFIRLLGRLMENSPPVVALLKTNPFPEQPPSVVRALLFEYDFTTPAERRESGRWWKRKFLGFYCPVLMTGMKAYPYYTAPPDDAESERV